MFCLLVSRHRHLNAIARIASNAPQMHSFIQDLAGCCHSRSSITAASYVPGPNGWSFGLAPSAQQQPAFRAESNSRRCLYAGCFSSGAIIEPWPTTFRTCSIWPCRPSLIRRSCSYSCSFALNDGFHFAGRLRQCRPSAWVNDGWVCRTGLRVYAADISASRIFIFK